MSLPLKLKNKQFLLKVTFLLQIRIFESDTLCCSYSPHVCTSNDMCSSTECFPL